MICDRWEFNFPHHHPIHLQFQFDEYVPRSIVIGRFVIKVPILDTITDLISVLGCVYIQVSYLAMNYIAFVNKLSMENIFSDIA